MIIFNLNEEALKKHDTVFTATEIAQQPKTWIKTIEQIKGMKGELKAFVEQVTKAPDFDVVLTGAGTSEFVGNSIFSYLNTKLNHKVKSYGTTDIVETPKNFLSETKPTLLVSYGRSGNSPESMAAIGVANKVCKNIKHLVITCNPNGAMSVDGRKDPNAFVIDLTPETHDKSFAMTSSYSNMYLASLLALTLDEFDQNEKELKEIIDVTQKFIDEGYKTLMPLIEGFDYKRLVYLGANTLKGVAQESALKTLELCAGKVTTSFDTPMGFRHGPKSIINPETLTVVYVGDNLYQRQYERDIILEMSKERNGNKILVVSSHEDKELENASDCFVNFNIPSRHNNVFLGLAYITVAQALGMLKAIHIGNTPDNPCASGTVNRVVKGVIIYDYKGE